MGEVFEAEEGVGGRRVAIKLIGSGYGDSVDAVERFRREGRLASCLAHSRCVFVYTADEDAGRPYIVMELMPGRTLQQLVDADGPLRAEDAVAKILDVIDGLREAHAQGVVHRDVKPSNCFLEADGRVKVGDFGLAKSLALGGSLTQTGTFLGTMLYAAPEQIRRDPVDAQSDLYSVAATLYFLLTGRAPFECGDAVATVAKVVSEPAPSMQTVREDMSPALDRVVLKGLERDRDRRWRDLDEFRQALLPFAPGRLLPARRGVRFAAFLIDLLLFYPLGLYFWYVSTKHAGEESAPSAALTVGVHLLFAIYFIVFERRWGCTLGKRAFGLRVCVRWGIDPPGWGRSLARTLPFDSLFLASAVVMAVGPLAGWEGVLTRGGVASALNLAGILLPVTTMRARNGWRGLHEFISGTRTVQLPVAEQRLEFPARVLKARAPRPADVPERIGPFAVYGLLRAADSEYLLLAEDAALGRSVILRLRPSALSANDPTPVQRPTRWRWLAGGKHGTWRWDTYPLPVGVSLADLAKEGRRLSWPETRHVLEQLASELTAACADGSLPALLSAGQIWVQTGGQVQLIDFPLDELVPAKAIPAKPEERAVALLADAARLALEGSRNARSAAGPIRAPLPGYATRLLDRLTGDAERYRQPREFEAELTSTCDRPAEVTRAKRGACLMTLAVLHLPGLALTLLVACGLSIATVLVPWSARVGIGELQSSVASAGALDDRELLTEAESMKDFLNRMQSAALGGLSWPNAQLARIGLQYLEQLQAHQEDRDHAQLSDEEAAAVRQKLRKTLDEMSSALQDNDSWTGVESVEVAAVVTVFPALFVLWAFVSRSGFSFRFHGLTLVRHDGRQAGRFRCACRTFLVWVPIGILFALSMYWTARHLSEVWVGRQVQSSLPWLSILAWWLGVVLLPLWLVIALRWPRRGPHDWLAGTYLVPR